MHGERKLPYRRPCNPIMFRAFVWAATRLRLGPCRASESISQIRSRVVPHVALNRAASQCPPWVKSRHRSTIGSCPFYPQKRTLVSANRMSAKYQKRTFFHQLGNFANRVSRLYGGRPASRQAFAKGSASVAGSASAVQNPRALNEGCNDKTCAVSAFASSKLPSLTRGATSKL